MNKKENHSTWMTKTLNPAYLHDSGLLFKINLEVLNLCGFQMEVVDGDLKLIDLRKEPERAVYDKNTYKILQDKLSGFMQEFAGFQMDKRRDKLGWAYQSYHGPITVVRKENAKKSEK